MFHILSILLFSRNNRISAFLFFFFCLLIDELKRRARIEIPSDYGRNMMGVLDETGKLTYGQVFIQYSKDLDKPQADPIVYSGSVVVTKFPALHPGDMRKFEAVDIPELHHMVDCIVFPRQGKRPHPDEMAGSDLDGDEYFVTWLPELILKRDNVVPMNFDPPKKIIHIGSIETSDMTRYIADYIKNDKLGLIANAHLVQADKNGIFSSECQEIAAIHAKAVDFAKTGYSPDLKENHRSYTYPDFMEKTDKSTYSSSKVLGHLFRQCRQLSRAVKATVKQIDRETLTPDKIFIHPKWETYKASAEKILARYNRHVSGILEQYGIEKESEVMSGCIGRMTKITQRNETYDAKMLIGLKIKDLHKRTRHEFFMEFGGENASQQMFTDDMVAKAPALHCVTYSQKAVPVYLSCPWVFADILCELCLLKEQSIPRISSTQQRISNEASTYREYANAEFSSDRLSRDNLPEIYRYFKENPWLQSGVGVLIHWRKSGAKTAITRIKLLTLFVRYAVANSYIVATLQEAKEQTSTDRSGESGSRQTLIGDLLLKFLSFCSSYRFVEEGIKFGSPLTCLIDPNLSKKGRFRLKEKAEQAFHDVSLSGALHMLGRSKEFTCEYIEKKRRVSDEIFHAQDGVINELHDRLPSVQVSFNIVNHKTVCNVKGPRSHVYDAQDLIAKWTQSIPAELRDFTFDYDTDSDYGDEDCEEDYGDGAEYDEDWEENYGDSAEYDEDWKEDYGSGSKYVADCEETGYPANHSNTKTNIERCPQYSRDYLLSFNTAPPGTESHVDCGISESTYTRLVSLNLFNHSCPFHHWPCASCCVAPGCCLSNPRKQNPNAS